MMKLPLLVVALVSAPMTILCTPVVLRHAEAAPSYGPLPTSRPWPSSSPNSPTRVTYAGVNIPGFEFGCDPDGSCPLAAVSPPGQQGLAQLDHFINTDNLTAFRLPVSWQYLVNNHLSGVLNTSNFAAYDGLVQGCLERGGKLCIVDIHNYGRWNGQIVGQSNGVKTADLVNLWTQLAQKYKNKSEVAFGIMNEPHNLSFTGWLDTLQSVVTAVRNTGALHNTILLPGTDYCAAGALLNGHSKALAGIKNPDGSTAGLVLDIHVYLDSNNTGTQDECTTDMIDEALSPLASALRKAGRKAFLSETGGSSNETCIKHFCNTVTFLNDNADVYLGYTTWAAGSFSTKYVLSVTPYSTSGGSLVDQPLVQKCILPNY